MCCCLLPKDEKKEKNSLTKPEFVNESYDVSDNDEMEIDSRERKAKINKHANDDNDNDDDYDDDADDDEDDDDEADDDEMVPEIYDPDDAHGSTSGDILSYLHNTSKLYLQRPCVLGMMLNSSVVVLSMTSNSCGAIEEMIL